MVFTGSLGVIYLLYIDPCVCVGYNMHIGLIYMLNCSSLFIYIECVCLDGSYNLAVSSVLSQNTWQVFYTACKVIVISLVIIMLFLMGSNQSYSRSHRLILFLDVQLRFVFQQWILLEDFFWLLMFFLHVTHSFVKLCENILPSELTRINYYLLLRVQIFNFLHGNLSSGQP